MKYICLLFVQILIAIPLGLLGSMKYYIKRWNRTTTYICNTLLLIDYILLFYILYLQTFKMHPVIVAMAGFRPQDLVIAGFKPYALPIFLCTCFPFTIGITFGVMFCKKIRKDFCKIPITCKVREVTKKACSYKGRSEIMVSPFFEYQDPIMERMIVQGEYHLPAILPFTEDQEFTLWISPGQTDIFYYEGCNEVETKYFIHYLFLLFLVLISFI